MSDFHYLCKMDTTQLKTDDYKITSHMFVGTECVGDKVYGYTYQVTFNKSLEHTGRIDAMADGVNARVKQERQSMMHPFAKTLENLKDFFKKKSK